MHGVWESVFDGQTYRRPETDGFLERLAPSCRTGFDRLVSWLAAIGRTPPLAAWASSSAGQRRVHAPGRSAADRSSTKTSGADPATGRLGFKHCRPTAGILDGCRIFGGTGRYPRSRSFGSAASDLALGIRCQIIQIKVATSRTSTQMPTAQRESRTITIVSGSTDVEGA